MLTLAHHYIIPLYIVLVSLGEVGGVKVGVTTGEREREREREAC